MSESQYEERFIPDSFTEQCNVLAPFTLTQRDGGMMSTQSVKRRYFWWNVCCIWYRIDPWCWSEKDRPKTSQAVSKYPSLSSFWKKKSQFWTGLWDLVPCVLHVQFSLWFPWFFLLFFFLASRYFSQNTDKQMSTKTTHVLTVQSVLFVCGLTLGFSQAVSLARPALTGYVGEGNLISARPAIPSAVCAWAHHLGESFEGTLPCAKSSSEWRRASAVTHNHSRFWILLHRKTWPRLPCAHEYSTEKYFYGGFDGTRVKTLSILVDCFSATKFAAIVFFFSRWVLSTKMAIFSSPLWARVSL